MISRLIPGRSQIISIVCTEMACSLKSDGHKYIPHGCVLFRTETISLSHKRENLLHVRYAVCRYAEIVWPKFCLCLRFQSFPMRRVSSYFFDSSWKFRVFLVFFCRDESPRTYIQNCIFLPSLRARRCVSIEFSCFRFPCTCHLDKVPWTFRRNRILHSRRTCRDSESQVHHRL